MQNEKRHSKMWKINNNGRQKASKSEGKKEKGRK